MVRGRVRCADRLVLTALSGVPRVAPGDDLATLVRDGLARAEIALAAGDVLVVASKVVSRAEGRFVDLATVDASPRARAVAVETGQDPRLVELVLRESVAISRQAPGVLVVRHRLGFVSANAGIDRSNAAPGADGGDWVLLLPTDPDATARRLGDLHPGLGVVVSDSLGRPFRLGTVGAAIGVAGLPALVDHRGQVDLDGRALEHTATALADQVAAAADLVAGQAAEARAFVHVRGLHFDSTDGGAGDLVRPAETDLYA